ncbi:MAG: hypothetical protein QW279_11505, partial [Candidatus Jordarchaeaceae archaeon]
MRIIDKVIDGIFVERVNKFLTIVEVNNTNVPCFLPDPGRLHELLYPGVKVLLADRGKRNRK